jgi:hypothetical protein
MPVDFMVSSVPYVLDESVEKDRFPQNFGLRYDI